MDEDSELNGNRSQESQCGETWMDMHLIQKGAQTWQPSFRVWGRASVWATILY